MTNNSNLAALACPYCELLQSEVIDSRGMQDGSQIRRRRKCLSCGSRFTSYEATVEHFDAEVKKAARQMMVRMVYQINMDALSIAEANQ